MNLFLQVVSPEVLDNVKVEGIISNIKTYTISSWGTTDPQTRLKKEENSKEAKKSGSMFIKKEMPKSVKMKLKVEDLWILILVLKTKPMFTR